MCRVQTEGQRENSISKCRRERVIATAAPNCSSASSSNMYPEDRRMSIGGKRREGEIIFLTVQFQPENVGTECDAVMHINGFGTQKIPWQSLRTQMHLLDRSAGSQSRCDARPTITANTPWSNAPVNTRLRCISGDQRLKKPASPPSNIKAHNDLLREIHLSRNANVPHGADSQTIVSVCRAAACNERTNRRPEGWSGFEDGSPQRTRPD